MNNFIRIACSSGTCEASWIDLCSVAQVNVSNAGEGNPEAYYVNLIASNGSGLTSFPYATEGEAEEAARGYMERISSCGACKCNNRCSC